MSEMCLNVSVEKEIFPTMHVYNFVFLNIINVQNVVQEIVGFKNVGINT